MKEQKTTKRLLSILLCLVLMIGMLPTMALAEEWGKVPSGSKTDTFEYADRILDVLIVKHVRQNGTEAPPAETFEFEVEDTAKGEKHPLSYYGIGVEDLKLSTNGVNDVEKTLRFRVPTKKDYTPYHWDAVTKSGTDTVAWYSKTFLLKEKNDGKPGWNYSTADYALTFWYDIEHNSMDLRLHQPGNDVYYPTAEFTNTYSSTSYELPFTKTVKQGGNTAPGKETFALEIFDVGVSSMEAHAKDLYTATVTTKGAGTYDGKLIISGPADQVEALLCEGFYVREKDRGADHWTYDDAVWHIKPQYEQTSGQTVVNVPLAPTNTPLEATVMNYQLAIYPTTKMKGANGIYYEDSETAVEKMTFTNTYTYDADKAKSLLTDAGVTPGDITLRTTDNAQVVAMGTQAQQDLEALGFKVELVSDKSPATYAAIDQADDSWDILIAPGDPSCFGGDTDLLLNWWFGDNVWMKTRCAWNTSDEWKKLNGLMNDALGTSGADQQDLWNQCFDILAENVVLYPLLQVVTPTASWRENANPDGVKVSDNFKGIGTTGVHLVGVTTVKA